MSAKSRKGRHRWREWVRLSTDNHTPADGRTKSDMLTIWHQYLWRALKQRERLENNECNAYKVVSAGKKNGATQKSPRIILHSLFDNESGDPYHTLSHIFVVRKGPGSYSITFVLLNSFLFSLPNKQKDSRFTKTNLLAKKNTSAATDMHWKSAVISDSGMFLDGVTNLSFSLKQA